MKRAFPPFLVPDESSVRPGSWMLLTNADGESDLPLELEHWDYLTTMRLSRHIEFDAEAVRDTCFFGDQCELDVIVLAHSDHTRTERLVARAVVPSSGAEPVRLVFDLAGTELGGKLTLTTQLVVARPDPATELAATLPGSILWSDRCVSHLQGVGAQFPTHAVDFSKLHPDRADAAWVLRLDVSDPDARFLSAVRLELNEAHPMVRRLLSGSTEEAVRLFQGMLRFDITRQLVNVALDLPEVLEMEVDIEATSLAGVLRNLVAGVWPREEAETVCGWRAHDRSLVETELQRFAGLGRS